MKTLFQNRNVLVLGLNPYLNYGPIKSNTYIDAQYEKTISMVRFLGGNVKNSAEYFEKGKIGIADMLGDIALKKIDYVCLAFLDEDIPYLTDDVTGIHSLVTYFFEQENIYSIKEIEEACVDTVKAGLYINTPWINNKEEEQNEAYEELDDITLSDTHDDSDGEICAVTIGERLLQEDPLLKPRPTFERRDPISGI